MGLNPHSQLFTPLCSGLQGYVEAAKVFEEESGTPPGVELSSITDRMLVRTHVQSGQVCPEPAAPGFRLLG